MGDADVMVAGGAEASVVSRVGIAGFMRVVARMSTDFNETPDRRLSRPV